jgi:hypothetical protein
VALVRCLASCASRPCSPWPLHHAGASSPRRRPRVSRSPLLVGLNSPLGAISLLAWVSARTWPPKPPAVS